MPTKSEKIDGFTLIEVMVSISIVSVIMATVLFNYSGFNNNLTLTSSGQELAIAIREAQVYGLTVREVTPGGGQFSSAYGVHFDPVGDPENYYIFADINGDKRYNSGDGCGSGNTECIERIALRNNVKISNICDGFSCPPEASVTMMDVTFLRPNPDASIYFSNSTGQIKVGPSLTGKIILSSQSGKTLTVTVESTGQVLVQ